GVLVDGSGDRESGAGTADAGFSNGKHVVLASKEADSVVGPILYRKARAAGLVYSPVDGDQPSLLIKLVAWARELGLEVLAAGKGGGDDFGYDPPPATRRPRPQAGHVAANGAGLGLPRSPRRR